MLISRRLKIHRCFFSSQATALPATAKYSRPAVATPSKNSASIPAASAPVASTPDSHFQEVGQLSPSFLEDASDSTNCWSTTFRGIGSTAFPKESIDILLAPLEESDIEIKPDGLIYLPEIKYRRILNRAFGPGAWGMAPRGPHNIINKTLTREYALIVMNRFVSQARGEQDFFSPDGLPTATEGVKSNALMRCCKDLGIASELWDPAFIRKWKSQFAAEVWATDVRTKAKRKLWRLKTAKLGYPYQE
eukprot:Partr_v1_DN24836_c1_g1_i1_m29757 putative Mitochondrial genome maintenance protein mgm101